MLIKSVIEKININLIIKKLFISKIMNLIWFKGALGFTYYNSFNC